jgi:MoaA/NifB/PqqE/SkfB family radical SAM enzyme
LRIQPILQTWVRTLRGQRPSLSIEITRECPLRCPGCYAYEDAHLGGPNLRSVADFKGAELISNVLALVDKHKPLHLSIVGGDPLVRYRELDVLLPQLARRGIHVQVVTSAFRPITPSWALLPNVQISVSVDGLQPEHDERRKPATYEKIRRNIQGQHVAIHCTITSAMFQRRNYFRDFIAEWSANESVERIWMSIFTPQRGTNPPECLSDEQRRQAVEELIQLRTRFPKLDMAEKLLREFLRPPPAPADCIFARTTTCISADLETRIGPCQFGGDPDCSRCGCMASMALAAIGNHRVVGPITAKNLFTASAAIGNLWPGSNGKVLTAPTTKPGEDKREELVKIAM